MALKAFFIAIGLFALVSAAQRGYPDSNQYYQPPPRESNRLTRPSRPCTFNSDCHGKKAQCQRNKCVTPSDPNFRCNFRSDCYDVPKVDCQRNKCVDPSMASFKCNFDSDCFHRDDCVRGKCVARRFGSW